MAWWRVSLPLATPAWMPDQVWHDSVAGELSPYGFTIGSMVVRLNTALKAYQAPWHFLYFLPLPQWQGSLRPGVAAA